MTNFETQARKLLEEITNHAFYEGVEIDPNEDYATDGWEPSIEEALDKLLALHQAKLERAEAAARESLADYLTEMYDCPVSIPCSRHPTHDLHQYLISANFAEPPPIVALRGERQAGMKKPSHD